MPILKDLREDRFAIAITLLSMPKPTALRWAGWDVDEWTDGGMRSFASKLTRKDRIARRIKEITTVTSQSETDNLRLINSEQLLAKASQMVELSKTPAEFKTSTELYLKLREDVNRELRNRVPDVEEEAKVGSEVHSRRLNAAVQVLNHELLTALGIPEAVEQPEASEAIPPASEDA